MVIKCYVCGEPFNAVFPIESTDDETCLSCLPTDSEDSEQEAPSLYVQNNLDLRDYPAPDSLDKDEAPRGGGL